MRPLALVLRGCDAMMAVFITWAAIDAVVQGRRRRRSAARTA